MVDRRLLIDLCCYRKAGYWYSKMKLAVVILTAFVVATTAQNATFYKVEEPIEDQYIVVIKPGYDVEAVKKAIFGNFSGIFTGSSVKHTYTKAIQGFSAKLTHGAVEKLLAREEIKYITQDGVVRISAVASWGLDRVNQRKLPLDGSAKFLNDGAGVNAYVIDTGIYPESLYFEGRAAIAFDAFQDGYNGVDCNGHGTHCAGTVGSSLYGVANKVNLFGVKVLNCGGSGSFSDVIAGCDYVAKSAQQPAVASMSLGGGANQATDDAVRGMIKANIPVVVAAGNEDVDACSRSPARVEEAITVGATDSGDYRAYFSNYGTCVDIFAPGVDIPSAWIGGPEETRTISGTSMACPHVTGAVAMAHIAKPGRTPAQLKRIVTKAVSTKDNVLNPGSGSKNRFLYIPENI